MVLLYGRGYYNMSLPYRNAKYMDSNHTIIDCELNHPEYGWVPYSLNPDDTDMTIDNNELLAVMTTNNDIADFVFIGRTVEEKAEDIRYLRDALLFETDWMASQDRTMTSAEKTYRQALRDITDQENFPYSVTWPTKP